MSTWRRHWVALVAVGAWALGVGCEGFFETPHSAVEAGNAALGADDLGGAVLGLEDDVAAFGSEGDTDDVREFVDTFLHLLERGAILGVEVELLGRLGGGGHAGAASGEGGGGCVGLRKRGGFVSRARSDAGRGGSWRGK